MMFWVMVFGWVTAISAILLLLSFGVFSFVDAVKEPAEHMRGDWRCHLHDECHDCRAVFDVVVPDELDAIRLLNHWHAVHDCPEVTL